MDESNLQQILEDALDKVKKDVRTDSYPMSIGEVVGMYERDEIILQPEYQRYFRWTDEQKSKLIESILIGLPLPSFFMAQNTEGNWEVVDGMQRLSTILDFMGELKNNATKQEKYEKFKILSGELFYLESFVGKSWKEFSRRIQLDFKRSKIQITILMRTDNIDAKFELFQRLNSGGTSISGQEFRNSILAGENMKMLKWIEELSNNDDFKKVTALSQKDKNVRYDMELVLRFISLLKYPNDLQKHNGIDVFLTSTLRTIMANDDFDFDFEKQRFEKTFKTIFDALGKNALKFKGAIGSGKFSISFFEVVALGIAQNIDNLPTNIKDKIESVGEKEDYINASGSGKTAKARIPKLLNLGLRHFSGE